MPQAPNGWHYEVIRGHREAGMEYREVWAWLSRHHRDLRPDAPHIMVDFKSQRREAHARLERGPAGLVQAGYVLPIEPQVERCHEAWLQLAMERGWSGDWRGTVLNLQVGASTDDGYWSDTAGTGTTFGDTEARLFIGHHNTSTIDVTHSWHRFTGVSGLSGVTIDDAVFSVFGDAVDSGSGILTKISADDSAAPTAPTSAANADGKTLTTANVDWDDPGLSTTAHTAAPDISTVIQELADSYDPSAIVIHWKDDGTSTAATNVSRASSYDRATAEAATLDITHSTAGGTAHPVAAQHGLTIAGRF